MRKTSRSRSATGERFVDRDVDILRRRSRAFVHELGWLGLPEALAVVIQCEVPGDVKQPGPDLTVGGRRDLGPAHPQEDVLGQVTGRFRMSDRSAEVPEQAALVGGECCFGVDGHASLLLRTR